VALRHFREWQRVVPLFDGRGYLRGLALDSDGVAALHLFHAVRHQLRDARGHGWIHLPSFC